MQSVRSERSEEGSRARLFVVLRLGAWLAVCIVCARGTLAAEEPEKSTFLEEYARASAKLEEVASRVCIVELETRPLPEWDGKVEVRYRANGSSASVRINEQSSKGTKETFVVATPTRTFSLHKGPGRDQFVLSRLEGPSDYVDRMEYIRSNARLPFAPYCFYGARIVDIMKQSDFRLTGVSDVEYGGTQAVSVSGEWPFELPDGAKCDRLTRFVFSPDDCWAMQEYEDVLRGYPARQRALVHYSESIDGVPVANAFEWWKEKEGGERYEQIRVEATEVQLTPAPMNEFTLQAAGLPDLEATPRERYANRVAYWLLGMSLLGVLASIALRRYANRNQH